MDFWRSEAMRKLTLNKFVVFIIIVQIFQLISMFIFCENEELDSLGMLCIDLSLINSFQTSANIYWS